jgi:hypothetical protein
LRRLTHAFADGNVTTSAAVGALGAVTASTARWSTGLVPTRACRAGSAIGGAEGSGGGGVSAARVTSTVTVAVFDVPVPSLARYVNVTGPSSSAAV